MTEEALIGLEEAVPIYKLLYGCGALLSTYDGSPFLLPTISDIIAATYFIPQLKRAPIGMVFLFRNYSDGGNLHQLRLK